MTNSIYNVHDDAKDKDFELELSWICAESGGLHQAVPKDIVEEAERLAKVKDIITIISGSLLPILRPAIETRCCHTLLMNSWTLLFPYLFRLPWMRTWAMIEENRGRRSEDDTRNNEDRNRGYSWSWRS